MSPLQTPKCAFLPHKHRAFLVNRVKDSMGRKGARCSWGTAGSPAWWCVGSCHAPFVSSRGERGIQSCQHSERGEGCHRDSRLATAPSPRRVTTTSRPEMGRQRKLSPRARSHRNQREPTAKGRAQPLFPVHQSGTGTALTDSPENQ